MEQHRAHPYLELTGMERAKALEAAGLTRESLFESVPDDIRLKRDLDVPEAAGEMELTSLASGLAGKTRPPGAISFLGGGVYDHFIPAAVETIVSRGEFVTAYTPYQAEASQGTLQATFEFQTLIAQLAGMEIAGAGVYDGATALAESVLMARRIHKTGDRVIVSGAILPEYIEVLKTYLRFSDVKVDLLATSSGKVEMDELLARLDGDVFAYAAPQPGFFGTLIDLAPRFEAAHKVGALCIALVNPITLGVLEPPGAVGADIACGDGQPLGCPQNYGGPSFGFIATRMEHVRQLPGRIVGETTDRAGRRAFCLTFQTREQHIRRAGATSNICTNHALMTLRAAVYLSLLGPKGLAEVGSLCVAKAHYLARQISELPGYRVLYDEPFFHEFVLACPCPAEETVAAASAQGILAGIPGTCFFPEMSHNLFVAVTEKRTRADMDRLVDFLAHYEVA